MPTKTKTNTTAVKTIPQEKPKKKKKKTNYLNNADLLAEVKASKEQDKMTDKMANMLTLLTRNFSKKSKFSNYTYNQDMQAYAMMMLVRTWFKFNEEKSNNPFAFYTQCVKNSFIQYLNQEKRQRLIRDEILVKKGLTPSFNYQLEYESRKHVDDEEDHRHMSGSTAATAAAAATAKKEREEDFLSF